MKLVTFDAGDGLRAGVRTGNRVLDLFGLSGGTLGKEITSLIGDPQLLDRAGQLASRAPNVTGDRQPHLHDLADVRVLAPVPRPGKVVCLGLNYRDHAAETGKQVPTEPVVFCKATTSVIGQGQPVVCPAVSAKVDYEVELAVVIGRPARNVTEQQALEHVAGYTIVCDVSARDYQHEKPGGQWFLGKSFDTFCPMGPVLVTRDEIPDPHELSLSCEVSGEVLQSSNTSQLIFQIPEVVSYLSRVFTLESGDVLATGTPAGVGSARTPPRFLQPGDIVRCRVEKVGELTNPVE